MTAGTRYDLRLGILVAALSLLLAGCGSAVDTGEPNAIAVLPSDEPSDLTPEEKQLRDDAYLFEKTVLGGAIVTAGPVALTCILSDGLPDFSNLDSALEKLEDCAAPTLVAGVVGAFDGYRTAKQQEAARKKVQEIDLITKEIEEKNAGIRKMVKSSRKVVEQNRERVNEAKLQVAKQEIQEEQLAEEQKRLQSNIAVMDRTIEHLKEDRTTYLALADQLEQDGQVVAGLRSEVETMGLQIAALEVERDALEDLNQTVRIG